MLENLTIIEYLRYEADRVWAEKIKALDREVWGGGFNPCIARTNQDIPYPEEIRQREIERRLKDASNTTKS